MHIFILSEYWGVGKVGLKVSVYCGVEIMGYRNIGMSDYCDVTIVWVEFYVTVHTQ